MAPQTQLRGLDSAESSPAGSVRGTASAAKAILEYMYLEPSEGRIAGMDFCICAAKIVHWTVHCDSRVRSRDASCLSVVSFNSTKRPVESFIVSYAGYVQLNALFKIKT